LLDFAQFVINKDDLQDQNKFTNKIKFLPEFPVRNY